MRRAVKKRLGVDAFEQADSRGASLTGPQVAQTVADHISRNILPNSDLSVPLAAVSAARAFVAISLEAGDLDTHVWGAQRPRRRYGHAEAQHWSAALCYARAVNSGIILRKSCMENCNGLIVWTIMNAGVA